MTCGYIYITTNLVNGKRYIGQKKGGFTHKYLGSGKLIKRAISKYGFDNFYVKPLLKISCPDDLYKHIIDTAEKHFISKYNADKDDMFYNIANGGQGGDMGEEVKKMRADGNRGKKHSKEWCDNVSKALKGKPAWNKGKKHSKEWLEHMSSALKGKDAWNEGLTKENNESVRKISDAMKGREFSEEHKRKLSEAHKGKTSWSKGLTKENSESIKKISEHMKNIRKTDAYKNTCKKIRCIETGQEFDSITHAEEQLHLYKIGRQIHGIRKSVGGLHFEFIK